MVILRCPYRLVPPRTVPFTYCCKGIFPLIFCLFFVHDRQPPMVPAVDDFCLIPQLAGLHILGLLTFCRYSLTHTGEDHTLNWLWECNTYLYNSHNLHWVSCHTIVYWNAWMSRACKPLFLTHLSDALCPVFCISRRRELFDGCIICFRANCPLSRVATYSLILTCISALINLRADVRVDGRSDEFGGRTPNSMMRERSSCSLVLPSCA